MRKYLMPIVAAAAFAVTAPAWAFDPSAGAVISMQQALEVANDIGVAAVSDTEFSGGEWQIDGRDFSGRYIEVDIDATTGAILHVDR